jgi:hypothetical protein
MIEILKQALEALESCGEGHITDGGNQWHDAKLVDTATTSLRQAIKELESQEPVAWADMGTRDVDNDAGLSWTTGHFHTTPLYIHPPQRTEQEQNEPFGYFRAEPFGWTDCAETDEGAIALYQAPQRTWQGLTDEDRQAAFESMPDMLDGFLKTWGWLHFSKALEAKLKQKNGFAEEKNT